MTRASWIVSAALFLLAPLAKPDTLAITFAGGNPGDGGTITTDGCSVCSDTDITGFDLTLLSYEFKSPVAPVYVWDSGALLGNAFIGFGQPFPILGLFDDYHWELITQAEIASRGSFSVGAAVPEPSSILLILPALLFMGFAVRRRTA